VKRIWLLALGAAAALVLLGLTFKPVVEGDGVGYFIYLHSVVSDHDLQLANEYAAARAAHLNGAAAWLSIRTPTGLTADYFPVGPALLSLPAYLPVSLVAGRLAAPVGVFGTPLTAAFTLASLLYGLLALALAYRLAREVLGSGRAAAGGVAAAAFATPFVYYLLFEPSYSHTFSTFMVTAFVYAWWRTRGERTAAAWLGLGLIGGLMAVTRWQDALLLGLVLVDLPAVRWRASLFPLGVAVGFAPQLAVDRALWGAWLPVRPPGQTLSLLDGHYWQVLLSSHHGLFVWTPAALIALLGIWLLPSRRLQLAFVYAFCAELVINGAAPDWWGGFAFGARRFLDLLPFWALALGALAQALRPRVAWALTALLAAWNVVLIANFAYVIRLDRDPGYAGLLSGQLQALQYVPHLFAQGAAVRSLLPGHLVTGALPPAAGLGILILELAAIGVAAAIGFQRASSTRAEWAGSHQLAPPETR